MRKTSTIVRKAKPRRVRGGSIKKRQRVSKPAITSTSKYMAKPVKMASGGSKVRNYKK